MLLPTLRPLGPPPEVDPEAGIGIDDDRKGRLWLDIVLTCAAERRKGVSMDRT